MNFEQYSINSIHFFNLRIPKILSKRVKSLSLNSNIVDLGCDDGNLIFGLKKTGHFHSSAIITGVDLSPERIKRFKHDPGYDGLVSSGDGVNQIKSLSVGFLISTMVIEHVPDDQAYLEEIQLIVKKPA